MAIPDFQSLMLPLLEFLSDCQDHSSRDVVDALAARFSLTPEELAQQLPSGPSKVFRNRVGWAQTYLMKAGLIESVRRGWIRMADLGTEFLKESPQQLRLRDLLRFDAYRQWKQSSGTDSDQDQVHPSGELDDEEILGTSDRDVPDEAGMAEVFQLLFGDLERANRVLDQFLEVTQMLGSLENVHDPRISVALQRWSGQRVRMRLVYAKWAVFGFRMNNGDYSYQIVLPADSPNAEMLQDRFQFRDQIDEAVFLLGWLDETDFTEQLLPEWQRTLELIRDRFAHWNCSPYAASNRPQLQDMISDRNRREELLSLDPDHQLGDGDDRDQKGNSSGIGFWLIAPGQSATYWEDWQQAEIIAIGWEDVGSLDDFETKAEISTTVAEVYPDNGPAKVASMLWSFSRVMKPGDVVFAKQGLFKIVGWGVVTGDYVFDETRSPLAHVRSIEWRSVDEITAPEGMQLPAQTLTPMSGKAEFLKAMNLAYDGIPGVALSTDPANRDDPSQAWWLNANPAMWNPAELELGTEEFYTVRTPNGSPRKMAQAFQQARPGDDILVYITSPQKYLWGRAQLTAGVAETDGQTIRFRLTENFSRPIPLEKMKADAALAKCMPLNQPQGSLFPLSAAQYERLLELTLEKLLDEQPATIAYTRSDAMADLFMPETQLDQIVALLQRKRNVILQGAPGTGKTFVARRIAYLLMGQADETRAPMVQFHQSTTYEDFIQGYRPDGKSGFSLKNGMFYDFCRHAVLQPDQAFVFIIDEINRGNLSKVFGELMMLIETDKRDPKYAMPLSYALSAEDTFYVPPNVHVIGTMNTADRSLSMVDYALRRRFAFIELDPGFASDCFAATLATNGASAELIADIRTRMNALNRMIEDDNTNLGKGFRIGHSFFVPASHVTADAKWLEEVIRFEIVPLISEYWFDDQKRLKTALHHLKIGNNGED